MIELTEGVFINLDNVLLMEIITENHKSYTADTTTGWKNSNVTDYVARVGDVLIFQAGEHRDKPLKISGLTAQYIAAFMDQFKR